MPHRIICYAPGLTAANAHVGHRFTIANEAVRPSQDCQAIRCCNPERRSGATTEFLLAGKPVLALPTSLEQQVTAERVAELGCGIKHSLLDPEHIASAIDDLLSSQSFSKSASAMASKYEQVDRTASLIAHVCELETLMSRSA